MKVAFIIAHPDDEVLGVGGTIARHTQQNDQVVVIVATVARYGRPTLDLVRASATELGVNDIRALGLPYMDLARDPLKLAQSIEPIIVAFQPEAVYTHWHGDLNSDHRAIAQAVLVACRPIGNHAPRRVLEFETPSSTEWSFSESFRPTIFIDIEATLPAKLAAFLHYTDEMRDPPHPRSVSCLEARARYWGQIAGLVAAEPFVLVREVVR